MKWYLLAAVAIISLAAAAQAAEPRAYAGANWWARYGTPPVNAEHQVSTAGPAPVVVDPAPIETYEGHGHNYVYYPGICDYSPPCTDWLWSGYSHNPLRCHPHCMQHGCRYGACGRGSCGACGNCGTGGSCSACGGSAGSCGSAAPAKSPVQSSSLQAPRPLPDVDAAALELGLPRIHVR